MKILELAKADRPREKLTKYGPERLNDSKLLAILLRTGVKGKSAIEVARGLFGAGGEALSKATVADLQKAKGLGVAKACEIVAALELGRRLLKGKKSQLFLKPEDVWIELREYRDHKKEHLIALYRDARSQEIKREVISVGTLTANLVHPREVFEVAIRNSAAQIILAHNHPSGDPEPSPQDLEITLRLVEAGKILGVQLEDHIILAGERYFSFKASRLI
jgi:DNA repair protein RadC